jgi:hypothetical protein
MAVVLMYRGERNFAANFLPVKVCSKLVVDLEIIGIDFDLNEPMLEAT